MIKITKIHEYKKIDVLQKYLSLPIKSIKFPIFKNFFLFFHNRAVLVDTNITSTNKKKPW